MRVYYNGKHNIVYESYRQLFCELLHPQKKCRYEIVIALTLVCSISPHLTSWNFAGNEAIMTANEVVLSGHDMFLKELNVTEDTQCSKIQLRIFFVSFI